jgi:hypothetical protein
MSQHVAIKVTKNKVVLMQPEHSLLYVINDTLPLAPILSQMNPVYPHTSYNCKVHFNTIIHSTYGSSKHFLSSRLSYWKPVCLSLFFAHACYMTHLSHLSFVDWCYTNTYAWNKKKRCVISMQSNLSGLQHTFYAFLKGAKRKCI